jgi:hypothetical protein
VTRIVITGDEAFPVYGIIPADSTLASRYLSAGVEVDQAFIDEYNQAEDAWNVMQKKLRDLAGAPKQET